MKLIDKDPLVAEIERFGKTYKECPTRNSYEEGLKEGRLIGYKDALHVIDTLEVKEVHEEPVSDDLEKEMDNYLATVFSKDMDGGKPRFTTWFRALRKTAIHFTNWQKEQFEKNCLAACDNQSDEQAQIESDFVTQHLKENNRTPTFIDAIEYGMQLMKEQMMKDATEAYIRRNKYTKKNVLNGFDVTCDAIQKFNGGDKLKVIVIKEE